MLSISDLQSEFDPSWGWERNPSISFDPRSRQEMFAQYTEQVKDKYLDHGNWEVAKKQAADTMKRTWGVTNVNGSAGLTGGGVVMQYPPERAPAYAGVENISEAIATQAIASIKAEHGADVQRSELRLHPIPGVTAQAYNAGKPVPYMLMWAGDDGVVQMLNPGRAFVFDADEWRKMLSAEREQKFNQARERAAAPMPEIIAP
jgi:hypothetical protein